MNDAYGPHFTRLPSQNFWFPNFAHGSRTFSHNVTYNTGRIACGHRTAKQRFEDHGNSDSLSKKKLASDIEPRESKFNDIIRDLSVNGNKRLLWRAAFYCSQVSYLPFRQLISPQKLWELLLWQTTRILDPKTLCQKILFESAQRWNIGSIGPPTLLRFDNLPVRRRRHQTELIFLAEILTDVHFRFGQNHSFLGCQPNLWLLYIRS